MRVYDEVWERFIRGGRLEFGGYMDPSWRGGHALSASLLLPVEASRLRGRLEPLREALRPFPFVSLHPDHFLHVTLMPLGFVAEGPEGDGEISRERLRGIETGAREVVSGFQAFAVRLANLNAFPGAAFVEVHDSGALERLRSALCERCGLKKPSGPPHLTLAYFLVPDGTPTPESLISAIARYRDWPVATLAGEIVELTLLELRLEYPEPEILAKMPMG